MGKHEIIERKLEAWVQNASSRVRVVVMMLFGFFA